MTIHTVYSRFRLDLNLQHDYLIEKHYHFCLELQSGTFLTYFVFFQAVKVGYPSKEDHPSCAYSRMDFETDEEFSSFFGRYRLIMADVIRTITNQSSPTYAFQFCDRWLRSLLTTNSLPNLPITKNSQIYIELDTIQWALDAVLAKLSSQEELTPILVTFIYICTY